MNLTTMNFTRNYVIYRDPEWREQVNAITATQLFFLLTYVVILPVIVLLFAYLLSVLKKHGYITRENAQSLLDQCHRLVYNTNMTLSNNSSLRNVKKRTISI